VCALHYAQLLRTILHRTDLIIFPHTLQAITTAAVMSIWGKGCVVDVHWRIRIKSASSIWQQCTGNRSLSAWRLTCIFASSFWTWVSSSPGQLRFIRTFIFNLYKCSYVQSLSSVKNWRTSTDCVCCGAQATAPKELNWSCPTKTSRRSCLSRRQTALT